MTSSVPADQRLDPTVTRDRLEAAVAEARDFFRIDPEYGLKLILEGAGSDGAAQFEPIYGYVRGAVSVDLDYFQRNPHEIRRVMAHEVAHLVALEVLQVVSRLPPRYSEPSRSPEAQLLRDAIETQAVRLERLFLRERPEPQLEPKPR